jgi:hypothetical protein
MEWPQSKEKLYNIKVYRMHLATCGNQSLSTLVVIGTDYM